MYLVTGGAGFIGSNIAAALAARGSDVVVCDWLGQDERWRNLAKHNIADIIVPERLSGWLEREGHALDAIVHMGAISSTTETDVSRIVENNIRLTLDLWDWCASHGKPLIYASSAAVYGDGSDGFDDDFSSAALARLKPLNAYGWSKLFVDRRIAAMLAKGMPAPPQWCGLRFFNVYGPNEYHKGHMKSVVAHNFAPIRDGHPMRLFKSYRTDYAHGEQKRDFVYVRDCVDIVLWLLDTPGVSGLFNAGSGHARSWIDLARALFAATGRDEQIEFIDMPPEMRPRYQYFTQAPMARLQKAGFVRPMMALEEGVRDYVQTFLAAADPYK